LRSSLQSKNEIVVELLNEEEAVVDMGSAEGDHTYGEWRDSSVAV
jgi:hypothetical protein